MATLSPFHIAYRHQVIKLPDLLTAPPHLPAQPFNLLQLHGGDRNGSKTQSLLLLFPTARPLIFLFRFGLLQIQRDRFLIHSSYTPLGLQLESDPLSPFSLPLQGLGFENVLSSPCASRPLNLTASGLQSMLFAVDFCLKEIAFCLF